jgi:hypothetical protein
MAIVTKVTLNITELRNIRLLLILCIDKKLHFIFFLTSALKLSEKKSVHFLLNETNIYKTYLHRRWVANTLVTNNASEAEHRL